jgi:hypothetical protein
LTSLSFIDLIIESGNYISVTGLLNNCKIQRGPPENGGKEFYLSCSGKVENQLVLREETSIPRLSLTMNRNIIEWGRENQWSHPFSNPQFFLP